MPSSFWVRPCSRYLPGTGDISWRIEFRFTSQSRALSARAGNCSSSKRLSRRIHLARTLHLTQITGPAAPVRKAIVTQNVDHRVRANLDAIMKIKTAQQRPGPFGFSFRFNVNSGLHFGINQISE